MSVCLPGVQVQRDAVDPHAKPDLDIAQDIFGELGEEALAQVAGDVVNLAGVVVEQVEMRLSFSVVPGAAAVEGQFAAQSGVAEGFERVVDGGEAQAVALAAHLLEEFLGCRMRIGGEKALVDRHALPRAA